MSIHDATVMILDRDHEAAASTATALGSLGVKIEVVVDGAEGLRRAREENPAAVVVGYRLEGIGGLQVIKELSHTHARLPVVMLTGDGTSNIAIEAIKAGAYDFLTKPADPEELREVVTRAIESSRRMSKPVEIGQVYEDQDTIIGRSRAMTEIYKELARVSAKPVPVLIRGETGTGKELIARAIYQHGHRAHRPFVAVNCAAIPENLLESELFGHEKGAFTGASSLRVGKFEQAHNGTLFLDEIGDMDLSLQAKLLRVLQQKQIQRVGSNTEIPVDVRIITATHRDLEKMMEDGSFRPDLFFRINVVTITIPPLRDRRDDIPLLTNYFLHRYGRDYEIENPSIEQGAVEFLKAQPWSGNIRELENTLRKALLDGHGYAIGKADLERIQGEAGSSSLAGRPLEELAADILHRAAAGDFPRGAYAKMVQLMESALLGEAMKMSSGVQAKAARWLGISRLTLREKLRQLGLHPTKPPTKKIGSPPR